MPAGLTIPCETVVATPAPVSARPQPSLTESDLNRLVTSEFQAIVGAITSTRSSMPAVTSWIPPP